MYFIGLLFISLLFGQVFRIPLSNGITVYPHDLIVGIMLVYFLVWKKRKKQVQELALGLPLKLFLFTMLISLAVNIPFYSTSDYLSGIGYAVRFFLYTGLYFLVRKDKTIRWDLWLYGTGVCFSILGILQYLLYPNLRNLSYLGWDPHYYRLFSTFLDPNFSGLFIVLTFFLGIYMYETIKQKQFVFVSQVFLLFTLILTLSRSSIIAFVIPFIGYLFIKRSYKMLVALGLFMVFLFFLPLPNRSVTSLFRTESSVARVTNWQESMALITKKPIFGYGFNLLRSVQEPERDNGSASPSHAGAGMDNSFLFVWATTGMVGLAAWMYLLMSMVKLGLSCMKDKKKRMLGIVYILSLSAISIHSMFINSFFYPWIMIWLWILTGIVEQSLDIK